MTPPEDWPDRLRQELGPASDLLAGTETEPYATDRAGLEHQSPRVVLRTASETDSAIALRFAADLGLTVALRGAGYSCNGHTLSEDLVVCLLPDDRMRGTVEDGFVTLGGGFRWLEVARELTGAGWRLPVLTANLFASVGGTLGNSGFGIRSIRNGCQIDHVTQLRVITPDGASCLSLGPGDPRFQLALGALGKAGLITQATFALEREAPCTRIWRKVWPSAAEMVSDVQRMAVQPHSRLPDCFYAFIDAEQLRGRALYGIFGMDEAGDREGLWLPSGADQVSMSPSADLRLHDDVAAWIGAAGDVRFLFSDFVFEPDAFGCFFSWVMSGHKPGFLSAAYVLAAAPPSAAALPFPFDPRPRGRMGVGVGLYCFVPHGDDPEPALAFLGRATDKCIAIGGKPLLYGASAYCRSLSALGYGAGMARLRRLPGYRSTFNKAPAARKLRPRPGPRCS